MDFLKVLLTIVDGMAFHLFEKFVYSLDEFKELVEGGCYGPLESTYPSITPVALASMATGLYPKNNGVVSTKVFVKGRKISSPLTAYNSNTLIAEPIWNILSKRGLKTLVTSSPQALPDKWKNQNTVLFDPYKSKLGKCSEGFLLKTGESEVLGGKWKVEKEGEEFKVTIDTSEGKTEVKGKQGEWVGPTEFSALCNEKSFKGLSFFHFRENDVYVTPPSFLTKWGNRDDLLQEVWEKVSKRTGMLLDGDYRSLSKGAITLEEYLKTAELSYNFFFDYSNFLLRRVEWDFAITYLPTVDNFQHLFYGIDNGKAFDYVYQAYKHAGKFVKSLIDLPDVMIVASDHGIEKVKKRVYVNKILERINVLKVSNGRIDWRKTKAYYAGGGIIRVNLRDREELGIVSREEFPKLINYIVRNLENYVDPVTNEKIFPMIYEKQVPADDREGDIELTVASYYAMSSNVEKDKEIEDVVPYKNASGDHGYYRKDDMYGVVILYGKGIARGKKVNAKIVDIVPTILRLFDVNYNKLDGKPIIEALR
ncbi:MAG: alkaline phosphatase family protein [Candidatus Aramenus sp.]|nr:alkaline phosphatase family protein [Candidatus Aramenus sp.]